MTDQQIPFSFTFISKDTFQIFKDGKIISTADKCGIFLCRKGEVEISLEDKHYIIKHGDIYIYMASTLVHLLHKSPDAEGIMVEVDMDYILPIANKVINVENILFIRNNPCISLSDTQYLHLEQLLEQLWRRIRMRTCRK